MDKAKRWIDDNSVEVNAALNVLIVGSVAFGAVFQIVEVDSDISKGWTAWEILRNIPRDNLEAYQQSVFDNPLPTKALTSGVAYTLGDFTCQLSQGKKITTVDLKRSLRSGIAGFLIHGPMCHYWLQWTEENLSFDGALWAIPVKVVADQTVWSLFLNSAYTTCIMSLQGMGPSGSKARFRLRGGTPSPRVGGSGRSSTRSPSPPSYPKTSSCCLSTAWRWYGSPSCPRR